MKLKTPPLAGLLFVFVYCLQVFILPSICQVMEEGTKTKRTIYVGGVGEDVDEAAIYETFSTFGGFLLSTESVS